MGFTGSYVTQTFVTTDKLAADLACYRSRIHFLDSLVPDNTFLNIYFTESTDLIPGDDNERDWGRLDSQKVYVEPGVIDQQYVRGKRYIDDGGASNPRPIYYEDGTEKAQWVQYPDGEIFCGMVSAANNISFQGDSKDEVRVRRFSDPEVEGVYRYIGVDAQWGDWIYKHQSGLKVENADYLEIHIGQQYSMPLYSFYNLTSEGAKNMIRRWSLFYSPGGRGPNGSPDRSCD
jgi:hypothetical protein